MISPSMKAHFDKILKLIKSFIANLMLIRNKKSMPYKFRLTTNSQLPNDFLPDEKETYRLSRFALKKLTGLDNLHITNHQYMTEKPETAVSISHTKGLGAALICDYPGIDNIGIDIEWADRKYRPGVEKYFLLEEDDSQLSLLEVWCAKEAAYKALCPIYTGEKTLVIKDFTIRGGRFYGPDKSVGKIEIYHDTIEEKKVVMAIALLETK